MIYLLIYLLPIANCFSFYLCFDIWWQMPLVVLATFGQKCVLPFCHTPKILSIHTNIQWCRNSPKISHIHSLLSLAALNGSLPKSHKHSHRKPASLRCVQNSHSAHQAPWQKMLPEVEWSMWKTMLLPCFIPKISQSRRCATASLEAIGEKAYHHLLREKQVWKLVPWFNWVVLTSHNWSFCCGLSMQINTEHFGSLQAITRFPLHCWKTNPWQNDLLTVPVTVWLWDCLDILSFKVTDTLQHLQQNKQLC